MNKEDQEQIRTIIREEITFLMLKLYERRPEYRSPQISEAFEEEISRFADLNNQLSLMMKDAGSLMKGCKYDAKVVDSIAKDVKNIDSKT